MPDILQTTGCLRLQALSVSDHVWSPMLDPTSGLQYEVPLGNVLILSGIYGSGKGQYFLKINGEIELSEAEARSSRMFKGLVLLAGDTLEVQYKNSKLNEDIVICGELFLSI